MIQSQSAAVIDLGTNSIKFILAEKRLKIHSIFFTKEPMKYGLEQASVIARQVLKIQPLNKPVIPSHL